MGSVLGSPHLPMPFTLQQGSPRPPEEELGPSYLSKTTEQRGTELRA